MTTINKEYGAFLIRLMLGIILLSHGLIKVFIFTIAGTAAFFASLGLPEIIAYLTIFAELAAGLGLIFGVLSRLAALLILPTLIGATVVHFSNGWMFSNSNGGYEFPLVLTVMALSVIIQGPGKLALGNKLCKLIKNK
jgi:putative oxidoreductase